MIKLKKYLSLSAVALILAIAQPAYAQKQVRYAISSGTGFFISMSGYLITNAHVVKGCDKAVIKGDMRRTVVDVVAIDPARDLALLQASFMPQYAAPLRDNIKELKAGNKALVMGYPGNHAITGDYALVDTEVLDVVGPLGDPHTIQFSDSAQKGNSGGPLLDLSGNVIGVVMGKSEVYRIDPVTKEKTNFQQSDVAISIRVLKEFLQAHGVYARDLISMMDLSRDRIVDRAKYYIVNVQCAPVESGMDPSTRDLIIQDLAREPAIEEYQSTPVISRQEEMPSPIPAEPAPNGLVIYDRNKITP